MSLPQNAPLPPAWVERIFKRITGIFGSQKVGAMWSDADMAEVKELWAEQLGRFKPESIGAALQRLIDSGGNGWPPTLPEFVELCRQCSVERASQHVALPAPRSQKPDDFALPDLSANRPGVDYLRWLRVVGSLSVARELPRLAMTDRRVTAIFEKHIADDFAGIPPECAKFLREWVRLNPDWRKYTGELAPEDRAA